MAFSYEFYRHHYLTFSYKLYTHHELEIHGHGPMWYTGYLYTTGDRREVSDPSLVSIKPKTKVSLLYASDIKLVSNSEK